MISGKTISLIKRLFFICFLFVFLASMVAAQTPDSVKVKQHSPKKATIMSACLPGLGQIYNKKYWKVPIVYAGIGTVGYFAITNNQLYQKYKTAFIYRTDNDSTTIDDYPNYSKQNLIEIKNYYRRNLELTVVAGIAVYALNIIDAAVDAHLYDFEVNDNLSMNIRPFIIPNKTTVLPGFSLCLKIK